MRIACKPTVAPRRFLAFRPLLMISVFFCVASNFESAKAEKDPLHTFFYSNEAWSYDFDGIEAKVQTNFSGRGGVYFTCREDGWFIAWQLFSFDYPKDAGESVVGFARIDFGSNVFVFPGKWMSDGLVAIYTWPGDDPKKFRKLVRTIYDSDSYSILFRSKGSWGFRQPVEILPGLERQQKTQTKRDAIGAFDLQCSQWHSLRP